MSNDLEDAVSKIEKRNKSIVHRLFIFSLILILVGGVLYAVPNVELHAAGEAVAIVGFAMLLVMSA
jgi:amino acid permease